MIAQIPLIFVRKYLNQPRFGRLSSAESAQSP